MAYSTDFTGENFSLIGLNQEGDIIGDLDTVGTTVTIHPVDTAEAN